MITSRSNTAIPAADKPHDFLLESYNRAYAAKYGTNPPFGSETGIKSYAQGLGSGWELANTDTGESAITHATTGFNNDHISQLTEAQRKSAFKFILVEAYNTLKAIDNLRKSMRPGSVKVKPSTGTKSNTATENTAILYGSGFLEKHGGERAKNATGKADPVVQSTIEKHDFRGNPINVNTLLMDLEFQVWDKVQRWLRILAFEDDYSRRGTNINSAS